VKKSRGARVANANVRDVLQGLRVSFRHSSTWHKVDVPFADAGGPHQKWPNELSALSGRDGFLGYMSTLVVGA